MNVLLIGGTGFIGRHLVTELTGRGHHVRVLSRSARPRTLPADVLHFTGDITTAENVVEASAGCEALVLLAGREDVPWLPRRDRDGSAMFAVNVLGTHRTLTAAREAGVRRAVVVTSCLTFGFARGGRAVDGTEPAGILGLRSPYVLSRIQQEHAALDTARSDFRVTCVAPSAVVGAGDDKLFGPLVRASAGRWPLPVPRGGFNFITVGDVVVGIANVVEGQGERPRYLFVSENLTYGEILDFVASAMNRSRPRLSLPRSIVRAVVLAAKVSGTTAGRQPALADASQFLNERVFYDGRLAVSEIGLPQSPIEDAIRRAVAGMLNDGPAEAACDAKRSEEVSTTTPKDA